jgi:hypothetical protein
LLPGNRILQVLTRPGSVPRAIMPVIPTELASQALSAAEAVFEVQTPWDIHLHADLNDITIHDWGNREYCVPRGATTLDLVGDLAYDASLDAPGGPRAETWRLKAGALLLLEETHSPVTGLEADADPAHRQVVRLTRVEAGQDPLLDDGGGPQPLTHLTWAAADALTFPLCVATQLQNGTYATGLSLARGNILVADQGRTVDEWHPEAPTAPHESGIELRSRAFRLRLNQGPVSFVVARQRQELDQAASALIGADPRRAVPAVACIEQVYDKAGTARSTDWEPVVPDLLASGPFDTHFVVEVDNRQRALLRFGDNHFGRAPSDNAYLHVTYRIGLGPSGNVGADALVHAIDQPDLPVAGVRNPLPAWGGIAPEPLERVKQIAPAAFRAEPYRAVTQADYARAAEKHPEVDRALATFRWTGSWHTVFVTIDPKGTSQVGAALETSVRDWVTRYTLAGYDLEIDGPVFVPLAIELNVCVAPGFFRSDMEEALLEALGSQLLPDGRRGFFHPDNFTFGQPLYLSKLVAAITSVVGVEAVDVTRFARQHDYDPDPDRPATRRNLTRGSLAAGRLEIVRLDNDPNFPENGVLELKLRGGK